METPVWTNRLSTDRGNVCVLCGLKGYNFAIYNIGGTLSYCCDKCGTENNFESLTDIIKST